MSSDRNPTKGVVLTENILQYLLFLQVDPFLTYLSYLSLFSARKFKITITLYNIYNFFLGLYIRNAICHEGYSATVRKRICHTNIGYVFAFRSNLSLASRDVEG